MEANKKKITDIFTGSRLLKVPFFQRAYVWGEEQWARLLSDMEFISSEYGNEEKGYFLGSIILKQELGPVESYIADTRTIIDGQQRLTTLAIFLKVLYLLAGMDRQFKRKFCLDDEAESVAIRHSNTDRTDFERVMELDTIVSLEGNSNIIRAYNFFKKNIVLERLSVDSINKNILFVVIDLSPSEDEQMIFDTINSLGVRLTTGELLKNYFFKESAIASYEKYWKPVFDKDEDCMKYWSTKMVTGRLKKDFTEAFFYSYLQIKIQERSLALGGEAKAVYRRTEGLFNNYKTIISDKQLDTEILVKEITNYGKLFREAFDLEIEKQNIPQNACIERICFIIFALDITTLIPYVMYVLKNVPELEERNKIFGYLESYIIRRMICDCTNKNYSDLFTENLIGQEVKSIDALKSYIEGKSQGDSLVMPTDETVMHALVNTKFRNNKRALAILYLLETKLREQGHTLILRSFSEYTLEHLMPKKWQENWNMSPSYTVEERDDLILTLGNMALLPAKLNTSISNSDWRTKKDGKANAHGLLFYASGVVTLENALKQTEWDEDKIKERANELGRHIIKIWPEK